MASLIDIMRPVFDRYGTGRHLHLLYGPKVLNLRQRVASILHHKQLTADDKRCKWERLRIDLLTYAGIDMRACRSRADAAYQFDELVNAAMADFYFREGR